MKPPRSIVKVLTSTTKTKPKQSQIFSLAEFYRVTKGIEKPQMKFLTGRLMKAAKCLLELCNSDVKMGKKIILTAKDYYNSEGLSWTLETVVKNFHSLKDKIENDEY